MKKVRFEDTQETSVMIESDNHTPRPYIQESFKNTSNKPLEALQLLECSNSVPYPSLNKTSLFKSWCGKENNENLLPSNELELSFLDIKHRGAKTTPNHDDDGDSNVISDFFLPHKNHCQINTFKNKQLKNVNQENKENIMVNQSRGCESMFSCNVDPSKCKTIHSHPNNACVNCVSNNQQTKNTFVTETKCYCGNVCHDRCSNYTAQSNVSNCTACACISLHPVSNHYRCQKMYRSASLDDAIESKSMAVKKFEQKRSFSSEIAKEHFRSNNKHEPTVSDLFEIIKFQNEQLQILQDKVDKFMDTNKNQSQNIPVQSILTKHIALEAAQNEHKMSIGVMTSFEVVRTSTLSKHQTENAQIQCNRSQISIKEIISKSSPINVNFLDGIQVKNKNQVDKTADNKMNVESDMEEKTVHDLSFCELQVNNEITPQLSPDQSLYLDIKDYSESESDNERSNVGWTYYNRVMTHVNDVLQDSEMPSSASALYQETIQRCMQMKLDKMDVTSSKKVTFGDDQPGIGQYNTQAITDTSLKMNQLAAKYLKGSSAPMFYQSPRTHNLVPEKQTYQSSTSKRPPEVNDNPLPKFLDITVLKQQPKLI